MIGRIEVAEIRAGIILVRRPPYFSEDSHLIKPIGLGLKRAKNTYDNYCAKQGRNPNEDELQGRLLGRIQIGAHDKNGCDHIKVSYQYQ